MSQRTNVTFTEEMYSAMKQVAEERGVPIAYLIREAVAAYLERSKVRVQNVHPDWGGWRGLDEEEDGE